MTSSLILLIKVGVLSKSQIAKYLVRNLRPIHLYLLYLCLYIGRYDNLQHNPPPVVFELVLGMLLMVDFSLHLAYTLTPEKLRSLDLYHYQIIFVKLWKQVTWSNFSFPLVTLILNVFDAFLRFLPSDQGHIIYGGHDIFFVSIFAKFRRDHPTVLDIYILIYIINVY